MIAEAGRTSIRWAAAAVVVFLALAAAAGDARAHAQLISSDPPDGAVLPDAPTALSLTFSEPVRPLVARLTDPNGRTRVLGEVGERGTRVGFPLPKDLPNGTHVLSWRVVSSDGHPIGGGLAFSVGAPSITAPAMAPAVDSTVRAALWAARFVVIGALVFGVGGVTFAALFGRASLPAAQPLLSTVLLTGVVAAAVLLAVQGLDVLGEPLTSIADAAVWRSGLWSTSYGLATLTAAVSLLFGYASLQGGTLAWPRSALGVASLLFAGSAFAAAGHAVSASPHWLTVPAVFLHAVAVLLWLGALWPLAASMQRGGVDGAIVLRRFSAAIPVILLILLASGGIIAVVQVGTPAALWSTDYGLVMLAKLALVAAMLILAAANRFWLTRPALRGDRAAGRRLGRSIAGELAIGVVVIAVLGLWRFTPPPRALAAQAAPVETQQVQAANEGVSARLSIHPPITGPVWIEVADLSLDGKPLRPVGVSVDLGKPSYGIGPFTNQARPDGRGAYRADGYVLPLDGFWIVTVTVLVSEFRSVMLTDVFDVRTAGR